MTQSLNELGEESQLKQLRFRKINAFLRRIYINPLLSNEIVDYYQYVRVCVSVGALLLLLFLTITTTTRQALTIAYDCVNNAFAFCSTVTLQVLGQHFKSDRDKTFHDLHPNLRDRLTLEANQKLIREVPMFRKVPEECMLALIVKLKPRITVPKEVVFQKVRHASG